MLQSLNRQRPFAIKSRESAFLRPSAPRHNIRLQRSHIIFVRASENGCIAFDCILQQEIMFRVGVLNLPADNPMQAELSSHIGLGGNLFCRRCWAGGSGQDKASDNGFHSLFCASTILPFVLLSEHLLKTLTTDRKMSHSDRDTDHNRQAYRTRAYRMRVTTGTCSA